MASIQETRPRRTKRIDGSLRRGLALHAGLVLGVLLSAFPFYWAVIMSTHSSSEIFAYPPKLLPGTHFLENVRNLFDAIDFFGSMWNSLLVIPQFVIMAKIGWIGSMTALIVPAAANAFGSFWMRQYMKSAIHDELLD